GGFGGIPAPSVNKGGGPAPSRGNSVQNPIHHPILSIPCCSNICITTYFNWFSLRYSGSWWNFQNPLEVHSSTYIAATTTTTTTETSSYRQNLYNSRIRSKPLA